MADLSIEISELYNWQKIKFNNQIAFYVYLYNSEQHAESL